VNRFFGVFGDDVPGVKQTGEETEEAISVEKGKEKMSVLKFLLFV